MSVHESQSRILENQIGKSRGFWGYYLHDVKAHYAPVIDDIELESFYRAINCAEPGFIRVDADELTYNMHVILRFEVEQALFDGSLQVKDLPATWNGKMQRYLGITPPNDALGVLQDTHWAWGLFGYFPTYVIGSMLSAQLFAAAERDIDGLKEKIAAGSVGELNDWLHDKIHCQGKRYPTKELILRATGKLPGPQDYIDYLEKKFVDIYK